MAERLARLEDVHDLAGVDELHRAGLHDVDRLGRRAVLDQDGLPGRVRADGRGGGDLGELAAAEAGERRVARQEGGDLLGVGQAVWSTTRKTGMRARRRTRYGSWPHMKLRMTALALGSAPMTIASQPRRSASRTIRFAPARVPTTRPLASTPLRSSRPTAFSTLWRWSAHSRLVGCRPGLGKPYDVPQMRAIVKTCTGAPERLAIRAARSIADVGISRLSEARRTARTASVSASGSSVCEAPRVRRLATAGGVTRRRGPPLAASPPGAPHLWPPACPRS